MGILIYSCKKEKASKTQGVIFCTIQDTASFETLYAYFSSLGLSIHQNFPFGNFFYIADTTSNKLEQYNDSLFTKKYLATSSVKLVENTYQPISTRDSVLEFVTNFNSNFSTVEANEWFQFIKDFKIRYIPYKMNHEKSGGIKVPIGQEDNYITEFKKNSIIKYAHR